MRLLKILGKGGLPHYAHLNSGNSKGAAEQEPQPIIAPAPPVEEAGIDIDDEDAKKKMATGKSSLKVPLATSDSTGLKL